MFQRQGGGGSGSLKSSCVGRATRAERDEINAEENFALSLYALGELWAVRKVPPHSAWHTVFGVEKPAVLDRLEDSDS